MPAVDHRGMPRNTAHFSVIVLLLMFLQLLKVKSLLGACCTHAASSAEPRFPISCVTLEDSEPTTSPIIGSRRNSSVCSRFFAAFQHGSSLHQGCTWKDDKEAIIIIDNRYSSLSADWMAELFEHTAMLHCNQLRRRLFRCFLCIYLCVLQSEKTLTLTCMFINTMNNYDPAKSNWTN